jgi:DnaJ-class molecular chaperone
MNELQAQSGDPFAGKTKPGDWRPPKTDLCPVCDGKGKGVDQRICSKCSGRGFIRP